MGLHWWDAQVLVQMHKTKTIKSPFVGMAKLGTCSERQLLHSFHDLTARLMVWNLASSTKRVFLMWSFWSRVVNVWLLINHVIVSQKTQHRLTLLEKERLLQSWFVPSGQRLSICTQSSCTDFRVPGCSRWCHGLPVSSSHHLTQSITKCTAWMHSLFKFVHSSQETAMDPTVTTPNCPSLCLLARQGNILRRPKPNITPGPAHYFKEWPNWTEGKRGTCLEQSFLFHGSRNEPQVVSCVPWVRTFVHPAGG